MKILIIATSHEELGNTGRKTGCWLEEVAIPYYIFKEAGAELTLASPKGGPIPLDPKSESIIVSTAAIRRFQKDPEAISFLAHSVSLDTPLNAENFDMIFLTGGHGPLWDFPENH
ncbi:MAG: type 1 glutamine amidotransferase domain-containing protein, partial [Chitinophaga rupis]